MKNIEKQMPSIYLVGEYVDLGWAFVANIVPKF